MIKEYRNMEIVMAEQFDASDAMVNKYDLDYEYDYDGQKTFYGAFCNDLWVGDWIITKNNGDHAVIIDCIFKSKYQEVK